MEAYDFLTTLAGVRSSNGSADRPVRHAVVDPAYVTSSYPGTLPRVTFDGESTLSVKAYASLYAPKPGDRVVMLPAGNTYVIVGAIGASSSGGGSGPVPSAPVNLQLDNGCTTTAGFGTPSSRLDHNTGDVVRLQGVITIPGGLSGTTSIATINTTAHRPSVPRVVTVRSGAGGNVATELTIGTDGTLKPLASLGASATRLGLDHLTFVK